MKPEDDPFRVLFIFQSATRRNNAAERMLSLTEPIGNQAYLTTIDEIRDNPLGTIWITPKQYRLATHGTRFDIERRTGRYVLNRSAERERFVQERVQTISILF